MTCQKELMAAGSPYPRTCSDCGLGPCKRYNSKWTPDNPVGHGPAMTNNPVPKISTATEKEGMRRFWLERTEDVSGTSGTGRVAEGVIFSNGWCALHWLTKYTSVAFYQSIAELEAIHGHSGATRVVYE